MKNYKKRKIKITGSILTIMLLLVSFTHCVIDMSPKKNSRQKKEDESDTNTSTTNNNRPTGPSQNPPITGNTPPTELPAAEEIVQQQVDVGVKNFDQIHATMSGLTGVSQTDGRIQRTFKELSLQLPTDNDIKSFLAANQVAITRIAAEYCDRLVDNGTLRNRIWSGIDINRSPAQVLNENGKTQIITQMLNRFWGENMGQVNDRNMAQAELRSLLNDLLVDTNFNSSASTKLVVKGVCTAALGSAQVTLL
jgi:hypothetical protein